MLAAETVGGALADGGALVGGGGVRGGGKSKGCGAPGGAGWVEGKDKSDEGFMTAVCWNWWLSEKGDVISEGASNGL